MSGSIPAIWRIDVEPDDHQHANGSSAWSGFAAQIEMMETLRPRLEDRCGLPVRPTWMFRLDPDIERGFGRADFVLERHRAEIDRLRRHGDPLGIHVHAYRWNDERRVTYSDYADADWVRHCIAVAAETFESGLGEPVRRASQGGYRLDDVAVEECVRLGIEVDVTPEPGLWAKRQDPSFGDYATAPSTDFARFPRRPYYPSRSDLGTPAASAADARPLLLVPLVSYDFPRAMAPLGRRLLAALRGWPRRPEPLSPWREWPSAGVYWDLVDRAIEEQPARYVAFAVRSDAPDSAIGRRTLAMVRGLLDHPLGKRLHFVDPLGPEIRRLAVEGSRAPV